MYSGVLGGIEQHALHKVHVVFLDGSPGHAVVQCKGLQFLRVKVMVIRAYYFVRKYGDSVGVYMVTNMITSINIYFHFRTGWVGKA